MELLSALLDIVDVVSGAIGLVVVWCTWVAPPARSVPPHHVLPPPRRPSAPAELDDFLRSATSGPSGNCVS
jgi:hypothetical protein